MYKKIALFSLMLMGFYAGSAQAITPGNLTLNNTAKLTYNGGAEITATAQVTVNVIAATPDLSTQGAITKAENQPITGTEAEYDVTATNNGPDTYTFEPATPTNANGALDTATNVDFTNVAYEYQIGGTPVTSVDLGASALDTAATAGATSISIPNDGGSNNNIVNGLEGGDTVVIDGNEYTINGAIDDSSSSGSITINLTTALLTSPGIGTGVFERKTFNVVTTGSAGVGNQTVAGATTNYRVNTTLRPTLTTPAAADATQFFQVNIVNITILKYVRNFDRDNSSSCSTSVTVDGATYYLTTGTGAGCIVDARPGEVLEYLLQVTTPTGGALTTAVVSDVLDIFTAYKAGTTKMGSNTVTTPATVDDEGTGDNAGAGDFPLAETADNGGLLIQDAARADNGEGDGNVSANATVNVIYQVDVN